MATMKNVHGNTVDHLGEAIVAGRYAAGASIPPEPRLCEELGVSRTVIRESVKSLVAKGLVSTGPKVGTRVLPEDQWNWFDPDVDHLAIQGRPDPRIPARPAGPAPRASSRRPCAWPPSAPRRRTSPTSKRPTQGMRQAVEEGGDYVTHDLAFHQGLLRACRNRMIVQMSKALGALLRTSFEISTTRKDGPRSLAAAAPRRAGRGDRAQSRPRPRRPSWC